MFSVITNIYRAYLNGIVHSHRKTKFFFIQLEKFDVCTTGDTAHIDTIFQFSQHTRVNMGASIFFTAAMVRGFRSARSRGNDGTNTSHEIHVAQ
jgi:hypothetical protein